MLTPEPDTILVRAPPVKSYLNKDTVLTLAAFVLTVIGITLLIILSS